MVLRSFFSLVPRWAINSSWLALLLVTGGAVAAEAAPFAYVVNIMSNSVSVIDTDPSSPTYHTVVATVPTGSGAVRVAITPDGAFAYVPNGGSTNTVSVIDTASNTVVATVSMPRGIDGAFGVAITPDGAFAYVTCQNNSVVAVIDTATNTVVRTVEVGIFPRGIAITPF